MRTKRNSKIMSAFKPQLDESNLDELVQILQQDVQATKFPGFKAVRSDSEFLKKFIRLKDGNVEAALKSIKKYYAYVQRTHSYINGTKPRDLEDVFNSKFVHQLRSHSDDGVKVTFLRVNYMKPKEIELRKFQLSMLYSTEAYALDPVTQKRGIALIVDLSGLRFEHVWCATPWELYRTISALLNGLPVRLKAIHLLKPPAIFWPVYKIILRLLTEKMRNRVYLHDANDSLHKYFVQDKLPFCLGGTLDETDAFETHVIEQMLQNNMDYEDYWQVKENPANHKLSE